MKTLAIWKRLALLVGIASLGCLLSANVLAKNTSGMLTCAFPSPPSTSASQADFDKYAWNTFISLNWPVSSTDRGVSDCSKALGSGIPRWQTFKTSEQVFLPKAENPGSWNQGYNGTINSDTLKQISKASNSDAESIKSHQEAVGGWLIDQNGNPTYFQMWVNENWYKYVVANQYYNKDNFSNSTRINLPDNAVEVKSAWRILTSDDDKKRYITQTSSVALFDNNGQPTGKSKVVSLGLVGMHAIVKAPGFPQWIWSTFEHVDNVPDSKAVEKSGANGSYWTTQPNPIAGVDYSYFNKDAPNPNTSPCADGDPTDCIAFTTPNPLTRITPIRDDAAAQNTAFQTNPQVKGTVFENYQLITTQWPTQPNNPGATNGFPTPTISANTTMESYIQSSSNCTNCHGSAALPNTEGVRSDFSFLFGEAQSASGN